LIWADDMATDETFVVAYNPIGHSAVAWERTRTAKSLLNKLIWGLRGGKDIAREACCRWTHAGLNTEVRCERLADRR
jgi:hypothetical protein